MAEFVSSHSDTFDDFSLSSALTIANLYTFTVHSLLLLPGVESGISVWNFRYWSRMRRDTVLLHTIGEAAHREKKLAG